MKLKKKKKNKVPVIKDFDRLEVIRIEKDVLCAIINGLYCPIVLTDDNGYNGVICSHYKTLNGFNKWYERFYK